MQGPQSESNILVWIYWCKIVCVCSLMMWKSTKCWAKCRFVDFFFFRLVLPVIYKLFSFNLSPATTNLTFTNHRFVSAPCIDSLISFHELTNVIVNTSFSNPNLHLDKSTRTQVPLDISPSALSIQSPLSPIYRCSSIRIYLTVRRRTAWAHYDKHTRMLLTQCLDSLWQPNSFNPRRDSNPSPTDKSVNKAIKAEQEPLLSPTKIP